MQNKIKHFIFICIVLCHGKLFSLTNSPAHREYFTSASSLTENCSASQVFLNPAGMTCPEKAGKTESMASSGFRFFKFDFNQNNIRLNEKKSWKNSQANSMFSQSIHQSQYSYGFFGISSQNEYNNGFLVSFDSYEGNLSQTQRDSTLSLGSYFSTQTEKTKFGFALSFNINDNKNIQHGKYFYNSNSIAYLNNFEEVQSHETFLNLYGGAIFELESSKFAFVIFLPSYSLSGKIQKNSTNTTISTLSGQNSFEESYEEDSFRTFNYLGLQLGFSNQINTTNEIFLSIQHSGKSEIKSNTLSKNNNASTLGFSIGLEKNLKLNRFLLTGLTYSKTIDEKNEQPKNNFGATIGILSKFNNAELGMGMGYFQQLSDEYIDNSGKRVGKLNIDLIDFILSSAFSF
jgi:hypothetical protein